MDARLVKSATGLASATIRSTPVTAPLRMFIPLTKVDAETRTVYGIATGETADRSGEICDYASTKPFYEAWSGDIAKATSGKSLGNVRAMHGSIAAGVVKAITFNDDSKQIEIAAKIVDDAEWKKVQEGVYTGFSQGGGYVKRWKDEVTGLQRYTANPSEVSLVDLPCLPTATFQMVKAAGAVEARHFAKSAQVEPPAPSNADVNAKATELAKAAGRETAVADFFAPAREALIKAALPAPPEAKPAGEAVVEPAPTNIVDGVEQVWKAKDGSTHVKKADALAKNAELDAAPGTKAVLDALGELGGKLGIAKDGAGNPNHGDDGKFSSGGGGGGAKGKWTVTSKAKDGTAKTTTHDSEGDAAKEAASRAADGHSDVKYSKAGKAKKRAGAATPEDLAKGLYTVARFAELLASLRSLQVDETWQATVRGDDANGSIAAIKAWVMSGCALLVTMIQEEANEIMPDLVDDDDYAALAMAAGKMKAGMVASLGKAFLDIEPMKKAGETLTKAGARNSKADQDKIQAMHDHAMDLGATCDKGNCGDDASKAAGGDMTKALAEMTIGRDLEKARGDALQKTLDNDVLPMLKAIGAKVDNIEKQPMPLPLRNAGTRVVTKGAEADGDERPLADRLAEMREKDPDGYQILMIKVAQQNPQQLSYAR